MKKNWEVKQLEDICEFFSDGNWIESKDQSSDGIRLIQTGNVGNGFFKDRGEKARYISESTFDRLKCTEIFEGDCLISRLPDPVGRSCILPYIDQKMITAVDCTIVRFDPKKIIPHFFNYYSQSNQYLNDVQAKTTGTTRNRISRKNLGNIPIPLPPLPEQQRIVAILDETFAAIDKAKENAKKNLQNARELFDSYLQSVFANSGNKWEEKKLAEVVSEMITGPFGSMLHKSDYVTDGVPVINPQNIVNGQIIPLQKTMVSQKTRERLIKYSLQEKDIIIARRGEMGRCAIVTKDQIGWLCGTGSLLIRLKKNADENYLTLFLSSSKVKRILEKNSIGTTMSNLNQGILMQVTIPLPPLAEQCSIVSKIDALSVETKRLEEIYQQKLAALDELKKSVLQKAFNGELAGA
ncbi:restriction endonuclease subunit S [Methanosarcina sp.]|uniref:restriction endonuclease subunit S n=1 Tax=Methanosarcina sp. TaxID=2213 RepID=UPI002AB8B14F|nr:restriction endonuclease subunit S [Methanosarcina sp.]MDY9925166.1 restriction endonuclease subunit S [Methanosarcina sp.]